MFNTIHDGHDVGRAFNSNKGESADYIYCITCTGHFHGCYCDDVECINCELLQEAGV